MSVQEQVRRRFEAEGVTIKEWAKAKGYNPRLVYAVLQGTVQCRRGTSHKIAIELGIKPLVKQSLLDV